MELILPDGTIYDLKEESHPTGDVPTPVAALPPGVRYGSDSVGRFGRIHHDDITLGYPRTINKPISFTNEIQPVREYVLKNGIYKVSPNGKCAVNILSTVWWDWLEILMGTEVREKFQRDGYGFMDNGPDKLYALPCGGNLVHEYGTHFQHQQWSLITSQDFNNTPNFSLTYENSPHLFIKQYLVFDTPSIPIGWTVDKGIIGGNGDVVFPLVTTTECALESDKIDFYPKPPITLTIYESSVLVDDIPVDKSNLGRITVTVDELYFSGSNTYGKVGNDYYLLEEMLVRGDPTRPGEYGTWKDRRVYAEPWNYPSPPAVIGWTRGISVG